jgi:hypothetical protein
MESNGKQKGIKSHSSFFGADEQKPYQSSFKLFGQMNEDSCVAAATKMLLSDFGIEQPEAFLSSALEIDNGIYLAKVPKVLQEFGLPEKFKWRNDLTFELLKKAVQSECAIVSVKHPNSKYRHALIIDAILNGEVKLRDSLPLGVGKSYAVLVENFKKVWLRAADLGGAVIYDD